MKEAHVVHTCVIYNIESIRLPSYSIHENVINKEDRSEGSCYSYVTLLSCKNGNSFQKHYSQDNCLRCC